MLPRHQNSFRRDNTGMITAATQLHNIIKELLPQAAKQDPSKMFPFMACGSTTRYISSARPDEFTIMSGTYCGQIDERVRSRIHLFSKLWAAHEQDRSLIIPKDFKEIQHDWSTITAQDL